MVAVPVVAEPIPERGCQPAALQSLLMGAPPRHPLATAALLIAEATVMRRLRTTLRPALELELVPVPVLVPVLVPGPCGSWMMLLR